MNSLRELQQRTYRAILDEEDLGLPVGRLAPRTLAARLGVYRNNARGTFHRTLEVTYSVVAALVGEECFRSIALSFLRGSPSRSGDLGEFGRELPAFLEVLYRDTSFEYLSDVARLEWALAEAATAADTGVFDVLALADVPVEDYDALRVRLAPATRLIASRFPVLSIWEAHQSDEPAPVSLQVGAEHVVTTCRSGVARAHRLEADTFAFIASLGEGGTLREAHEAALAASETFDLAAALNRFVVIGALAGFWI